MEITPSSLITTLMGLKIIHTLMVTFSYILLVTNQEKIIVFLELDSIKSLYIFFEIFPLELIALGQEDSVNDDREANQVHDGLAPTFSSVEQRVHDAQMTVDPPVCQQPDCQSPQASLPNMSNLGNVNLSRSWSCREYSRTADPLVSAGELESTPANGIEKEFPGRPERFRRDPLHLKFDPAARLLRDGSPPSSVGSPCLDSMRTPGNEGITSLQNFVAGMKEMVKLEYEKHFVDGQVCDKNHFPIAFFGMTFK